MRAAFDVRALSTTQTNGSAFARDVREGLSREPKSLPSRYFYDAAGSQLFQQITELDEYYLTRCEEEILETFAGEIAAAVAARPFRLVELGAGDGRKTEILVRRFLQTGPRFEYVPIDICPETIRDLIASWHRRFGNGALPVRGIVAEYFDALTRLRRQGGLHNLVLFLGSNIGNFSHRAARQFLRSLRGSLRAGDQVLIGFDLKKDLDVLHHAYNDARGITRRFNLNFLERINRELGAEFDIGCFMHYGAYNVRQGCMESWLVSRRDQEVLIRGLDRAFAFRAWEGIHVECSYKYDQAQIETLAAATGFTVRRHFIDSRQWFVDSLWEAA